MRMRGKYRLLLAMWLPLCASAGDKPAKNPPPARVNGKVDKQAEKQAQRQAAKAQVQEANQSARAAQQALNAPVLMRLLQMSPDEREAALSRLPPDRRKQIEEKLENFSKRPAEQQARVLDQQKRLTALPPERQAVARQALTEYQAIDGPRKVVIAAQLARLNAMTPEQRAVLMNRPAFRGRFSDTEIQMMNNLIGIVP